MLNPAPVRFELTYLTLGLPIANLSGYTGFPGARQVSRQQEPDPNRIESLQRGDAFAYGRTQRRRRRGPPKTTADNSHYRPILWWILVLKKSLHPRATARKRGPSEIYSLCPESRLRIQGQVVP